MANSAIQLPFPTVLVEEASTFRNRFINGDFQHWQRGFSFTPPTLAAYTADRWLVNGTLDGGIATASVERRHFQGGQFSQPFSAHELSSDSNAEKYARIQLFVAGGGGNEIAAFVQRIQNAWTFSERKVTVSFWARGDSAGTIVLSIRQYFGTAGDPSVFIPAVNVTLSTSWQRFAFVFDIPSVVGKTILPIDDNHEGDNSLRVRWVSSAGATRATNENYPGPVSFTDFWEIAEAQIEEGEIEDPIFDRRDEEVELAMCQRYYEKGFYDESANAALALTNEKWVHFETTKRIFPTITGFLFTSPPSGSNLAPGYFFSPHRDGFIISYASVVGGDTSVIFSNVGQTGIDFWSADAEL